MKIIMLFAYLCLFCSCITEKTEIMYKRHESVQLSECKSDDRIINTADYGFREFFPETKSIRNVDSVFFVTIENGDTLLAVINYKNDSGFAIISTDHGNATILGIFDNGNFDDNYRDNLAFKICYEELIENQKREHIQHHSNKRSDESYNITSTITSRNSIGPLITVNWGQDAPFDLYSPNSNDSKAGCTPIAIAQVMSYFEYPNALRITYADDIQSQIILDWSDMKTHNGNTFCSPICETCKTLSLLLREIGHKCNANYYDDETGAWPYAEYLSKLGYKCKQHDSFDLDAIETFLWEYRLALLCGFRPTGGGHTWVVDGVKNILYKNSYYLENSDGTRTEVYSENCKDTYLHFNFGWYGSGNGFILCQIEKECNGTITYPKRLFSGTYTDIRLQISNLRPNAAAREI